MAHPSRPRLLSITLVLLVATGAAAQAPLQVFQRAILNGDTAAARAALAAVEDLDTPTRAVLQAASMPVAERAMAMQQIARIYPDDPMADVAIVAGCTALMSSQGKNGAVPGVDRPKPGRKLPKGFVLVDLIRGFRDLIAVRRKTAGDIPSLDEADWMLRTLSVNEVAGATRRVLAGGTLPVPSPLKEDMRLRFHPFDLDRAPTRVFRESTGKPIDGGILKKASYGQTVPVPDPGVYIVELTAVGTGWTRLERLIVSDLTLVTQSWPGMLAVMGSTEIGDDRSKAAPNTELSLVIHTPGDNPKTLTAKTDASGLATFALPGKVTRLALDGKLADHVARITPTAPPQNRKYRSGSWKTHLVVDRPIYRPGETVQGRLLLRREEPRSGQLSSGLTSSAFVTNVPKGRAVELRFWPGTKQEVVLRGTTDAHGVLPFQMKLARSAPLWSAQVRVVVPGGEPKTGKDAVIHQRSPFLVQEFRRPVILGDASGPAKASRTEPMEVTLSCRYATGAPGSGLRADVTARCGGLIHRTSVTLDRGGKAKVPIHVHELPLPKNVLTVSVSASFHSPDGQRITTTHYARLEAAAKETAEKPPASRRFVITQVGSAPRAGDALVVDVAGAPGERILLATVRDIPTGFRILQLDSTGKTRLSLATKRDDFPGLQLVASIHSRRPAPPILSQWSFENGGSEHGWNKARNAASYTFHLQPPASGLAVEFDKKDLYRPGSHAEMGLRVTRDGKPARTTVAVTIVDETIYSLERDRNMEPTAALRPRWRQLVTAQVAGTRQRPSPWHVLGRLMRLGMMEAPEEEEEIMESEEWNTAVGLGGGAGGKFGGRGGGRSMQPRTRKRFRPTAFFVGNLVTDAEGRARFEFDFPDDLTKWRITAIAVDDTFYGAKVTSATETRLPVSVTPLLPRVLRARDAIHIGVTTNKEAKGRESGTVELVSGDRAVHVEGPAKRDVTVEGVQPTRVDFSVRASHAGSAKLTATAMVGETGDRAELPLPVLPDVVIRPVVASKLIEGSGEVTLPAKPDLTKHRTLRLLGNRDALLREASQYLSGYPYGCVEQVLSRLTPLFVAARTTRLANGGDGAILTEEQGLRLEAGMVALRGHLISSGRGFRWWHGDTVDKRMTALALHSLRIARDAGIDPERYGVVLNCSAGQLTRGSKAIIKNKGVLAPLLTRDKPNHHDAELAVALLRYDPKVKVHRQAVAAILECDQALSAGLLARIGLALNRAGDQTGAHKALDRILTGKRVAQDKSGRGTRFPMDRTAARTAHLLELVLRLSPKHRARAPTVGTLLTLQRDGRFGSTYSTASALHALALDAELSGHKPNDAPFTVTVGVAGTQKMYTLSKDNGFVAESKFTGEGPVKISVADTRQVHALLRGGVEKRGSTHPGWREPIRVTRRLFRVDYDATGKAQRSELAADAVPKGQVVELAIDVSCAEAASYLVVDCPLPAGFEVLGRPSGFEMRDDRVVKLVRSLRTDRPVAVRLKMIAAHVGEVAWPPAVAMAMYAPEMNGASKGARLTIVEPEASDTASATTPHLLTSAYYEQRLETAVTKVRDARGWKATRTALRELDSLFFGAGKRALLPLTEELIRRHAQSTNLLYQIYQLVSGLPEAKRARQQSLEGSPSELGFLMLAYTGGRESDGDAWFSTLPRLLTDDTFGGLSQAERRTLMLARFSGLVSGPWRAAVARFATKDSLLHSDSAEVAGELVAWQPVLRAAVSMLHSQPRFGGRRSALPMDWLEPLELEFGAAPSESLRFSLRQMDDIRWRLVQPLLERPPTRNIDWLYSLHHTSDRDRLLRAYDKMLTSCAEVASVSVLPQLLRYVPTEMRVKLGHHYSAALNHGLAKIRWAAFTTMPRTMRAQLPEAVLRSVFAHSGAQVRYLDALGERGIQIVRQWLLEGRSFLDPDQTCLFLQKHLKGLPLTALVRLADPTTTAHLTRALAEGGFPIAELQMQMHDHSYGPWRACLVEELARRGAKKVLIDKLDPLLPTYNMLLGAWRGEVAETLEVVRRLKADHEKRRGTWQQRRQAMPAYLTRAFVRSISPRMQPQEFLDWGLWLDKETAKKTLARFGLRDWRHLLVTATSNFATIVGNLPKRLERTLLPELLILAYRREARSLAFDRILAVPTGEAFLRSKLETREIPAGIRQSVANRVFRFSGLGVTYATDSGDTLHWNPADTRSIASRIRKHGFAAEWSAKERPLVQTLLRRRGILPASR